MDGYNLLNNSGIETKPGGPAGVSALGLARQALLDFLVRHLSPEEARATVVVFDAQFLPRPVPTEFTYHGMAVKFAVHYPDADSLLEQLIAEHTSPRQLTVISSDHRLQRAARRRRARFVDSEQWYRELLTREKPQMTRLPAADLAQEIEKQPPAIENMDPEDWIRMLGLKADELEFELGNQPPPPARGESPEKQPGGRAPPAGPSEASGASKKTKPLEAFSPEDFGLSPEELAMPIEAFEEKGLKKPKSKKERK